MEFVQLSRVTGLQNMQFLPCDSASPWMKPSTGSPGLRRLRSFPYACPSTIGHAAEFLPPSDYIKNLIQTRGGHDLPIPPILRREKYFSQIVLAPVFKCARR